MEQLLESWDRNCRIVSHVASLVTAELKDAKPTPDGWTLEFQLAHMHEVRQGWLNDVSPEHAAGLGDSVGWDREKGDFLLLADFETSKKLLVDSGRAVREAVIANWGKGKVGPYSDVVQFMQHMLWHDGWHTGLIITGLRQAGAEPTDEWEEENVWAIWRS